MDGWSRRLRSKRCLVHRTSGNPAATVPCTTVSAPRFSVQSTSESDSMSILEVVCITSQVVCTGQINRFYIERR
jgi:hypothetical protein